jgi:hypothetical protein
MSTDELVVDRLRASFEQVTIGTTLDDALASTRRRYRRRVHRRRVLLSVAALSTLVVGVRAIDHRSSTSVVADRPAPTEYGFAPNTPLFDVPPQTVVEPTVVVALEHVRLSVSLSSTQIAETVSTTSNLGSGSASIDPNKAPALIILLTGQASNDPLPPAGYVSGITRDEVATVELTTSEGRVRVRTVANERLPDLRFFLIEVPGHTSWTADDHAVVTAYDHHGHVLTDTERIWREQADASK